MKTFLAALTLILIVALIGCNDTLPTASFETDSTLGQESDSQLLTSVSKADRQKYTFTYDLAGEEPFVECRGELMQFHGILTINITEVTTPSGNLLVRGWIDYPDDGWAEGVDSHTIWMLTKGLNPYTETLKGEYYSEEDFWVQNWRILEWYQNPELGKLQVHWWGGMKFDEDGDLTIYRERLTCK